VTRRLLAILSLTLSCLLPSAAGAQVSCTVTLQLDDAVAWGALQFDVAYTQPGVDIDGSGGAADCTNLTASVATYNDDDAGSMSAAFLSLGATSGPGDLVTCNVSATFTPMAADFAATVVSATDPLLVDIVPLPTVSVSDISCVGGTTTTMAGGSTTSTTVLASTTTSTMSLEDLCTVDVDLLDTVTLGALQLDVDYSATSGGTFEGTGSAVTCTGLAAGSLYSFNDLDASQILRTSVISLSGLLGPARIMSCIFVPGAIDPIIEEFVITVLDASAPDASPIVPLPTLIVADVMCGDPTTTTTTSTSTTTTSTTTTSTVPVCGDGILQVGELCDDGLANSDSTPDACRTDCSPAGCGDGTTDTGEGCDDGAGNSDTTPDACRTDCSAPACGDDVTDTGEACDDGAGNSDTTPDACRTDCSAAACGDDVIDTDETCDDGAGNSDLAPDACRTDCSAAACGDDVIDTGEACDDGAGNSNIAPDACRTDCSEAVCGDDVIDSGEGCDDALLNSDLIPDACRTICMPASCGDGVTDSPEDCDDGAANSDADPATCRTACAHEYDCADADGSGVVVVTDAQIILLHAVGSQIACLPGRCDTTGDGRITASDAQRALFEAVQLPIALSCELTVTLRLDDAVTVGSIDLAVDYSATDSTFRGEGAVVECTNLTAAVASFDNDTSTSTLTAQLTSVAGIVGPADLAECTFRLRDAVPDPADLAVQVTQAADTGSQPLVPLPSVSSSF